MPRKKASQAPDEWCRFSSVTPKQKAIESKILKNFYEGNITTAELYRQMRYFGIVGMMQSDIPY